uniref:Uncharacterized protein n=1 Tax=Arundo donax TaxID=35708 RepID=A0A0A9HFZ2_ARUDO
MAPYAAMHQCINQEEFHSMLPAQTGWLVVKCENLSIEILMLSTWRLHIPKPMV